MAPPVLDQASEQALLNSDPPLAKVVAWWRQRKDGPARFGEVLRLAMDRTLDGANTGRWDYTQLIKTEKSHVGSQVEVLLQHEFGLKDGWELDYLVRGADVDCKYARALYLWEFPQEMHAKGPTIALVVSMDDYQSQWAAGLVRISAQKLNQKSNNQDLKRKLTPEARREIVWIWDPALQPLPPNQLLQMDHATRSRILSVKRGQQRVLELFRAVPCTPLNRVTIATLAQQHDPMRRGRAGRAALQQEGLLILGHWGNHRAIAGSLGLAECKLGQLMSVPVAPARAGKGAEIEGSWWRIRKPSDPKVPAPSLPRAGAV